ncbi:TonB-dependent receptor [Methylobacter sp.]|uniref:TonB-dependent receptor n=1 Tax=Methylobacter sp. TaxID=2051955 RepID=UPI002FDE2904
MKHMNRALLTAVLCASIGSAVADEAAQSYDIPAQSLHSALQKLADQAGVTVFFSENQVAGKNSTVLKGQYSPREALQKLLLGSGLIYTYTADNSFAIKIADTGSHVAMLPTMTIIGEKKAPIGLSTTEITDQDFNGRQAQIQDTAKLLEDAPGLSLQAGGGVSALPIIHGLNDERIKIDINGMTITSACANHMNPALSYIDRTHVGKIIIMQGVTPVSMGGDSIGGTISVQSPEPVFAEPGKDILINGKASTFYRSNGDAFGGNIAAGIANQNVRLDYTGSHSGSRNYRSGNGRVVESTAYESQNHALALSFKLDNHLLEIKGGQQHIPFQGFPTQRMDMTLNDSIFGNVHYKGSYDWGNLESTLYLENTKHHMDIGYDKLFPQPPGTSHALMPMDVRGRNLGYKVQAEIPYGKRDTFRIGNEFHANELDEWWDPVNGGQTSVNQYGGMWPYAFINLNNATRDRLGTFAEWNADWTPELKSTLGVRYDRTMTGAGVVKPYFNPNVSAADRALWFNQNVRDAWTNQFAEATRFNGQDRSRDYDTFDVTALMQFTPNKISQYEFGYARKNRAPSIYELYPWSTGSMQMSMIGSLGDGNGYVGNPNLKPETAHNISFTAAFHEAENNDWEIKATPYFSYVENFIDADRCGSSNPVCGTAAPSSFRAQPTNGFLFLNYANHDARLWGMDLSARADLFKHPTFGQFGTHTTMGYVRGERMDGGNLYHMMPFNAKLSLDHKLDGWKNSFEMQFVDAKSDVQKLRNELRTPSYVLLNAKTGYQWKNLSIDVGLDNILDKQYYHPLAGVNAGDYYAMSITFPDPGYTNNRNLPGMGRSVFVGMSLTY